MEELYVLGKHVKELETLKEENQRLSEQVKRLVVTEHELYRIQEQLDKQYLFYRKLYETAKQFNAILDLGEILNISTQFVLYELNFERCLIMSRLGENDVFVVEAMDGYYDETSQTIEALTLSIEESALAQLEAGEQHIICPEGCDRDELLGFRDKVGMDEYILLPLARDPNDITRILIAGNTLDMAAYQTRVEPDSEAIVGLSHLVSQASTAIDNVKIYMVLEESEKKYRTLFEDSRDAIYITTSDGRFLDFNQATLDLFGYSHEELITLDAHRVYVDPADRHRFQVEIRETGFRTRL